MALEAVEGGPVKVEGLGTCLHGCKTDGTSILGCSTLKGSPRPYSLRERRGRGIMMRLLPPSMLSAVASSWCPSALLLHDALV